MIGFLPAIYDDELVYSWFSRYYLYSGYYAATSVMLDLYDNKTIRPSVELLNNLSSETKDIISRYISLEDLVYYHTMFPEYGRFINPDKRNRLIIDFDFSKGNWINALIKPTSTQKRFLKYCPVCAKEDRENLGETYWHRKHQIRGIMICPIHQVYLADTDIVIDRNLTRFKPAENIVPGVSDERTCEDAVIIALANYMAKLFENRKYSHNQVGKYFNDRINEKYINHNGTRRMDLFYGDYRNYYSSYDSDELMTMDYMIKLFRGDASAYKYYCQLAVFMNITIEELLSDEYRGFDERQIFLDIALKTGEPIERVTLIGKAVIEAYTKSKGQLSKGIQASRKMKQLDEELLPNVKSVVSEIYGMDDNRPHRVTLTAVSRALNMDSHKIAKLPLCKAEIERFYESQEHYWAREIIWAVGQIEKNNEPMNFKHIRNYINLRKENVIASMNELYVLDNQLASLVEKIL